MRHGGTAQVGIGLRWTYQYNSSSEAAQVLGRRLPRHRRAIAALAEHSAAAAALLVASLPTDRMIIFLWILLSLFACCCCVPLRYLLSHEWPRLRQAPRPCRLHPRFHPPPHHHLLPSPSPSPSPPSPPPSPPPPTTSVATTVAATTVAATSLSAALPCGRCFTSLSTATSYSPSISASPSTTTTTTYSTSTTTSSTASTSSTSHLLRQMLYFPLSGQMRWEHRTQRTRLLRRLNGVEVTLTTADDRVVHAVWVPAPARGDGAPAGAAWLGAQSAGCAHEARSTPLRGERWSPRL